MVCISLGYQDPLNTSATVIVYSVSREALDGAVAQSVEREAAHQEVMGSIHASYCGVCVSTM